jgi:Acetyltransferase (GNAT) domain
LGHGAKIGMLDAGDDRAAGRIWQSIEARSEPPLACSWEWTSTWLRHYGGVVPYRFAVAENGAGECGIALVTEDLRRRGPFKLTRLHLGTAGEPSGEGVSVARNGICALPGSGIEVARALLEWLHDEGRWDELELDGFCPRHARPFLGAEPRLVPRVVASPCLDLGQGPLRPDVRERVRRSIRAFGRVDAEWATTPEGALAAFEELHGLHEARADRNGAPRPFASRRFVAFHRDLIARLAPRRALLFRVRAEADVIGVLYCLVDGEDVLFYEGGFAELDDRRLRPALVTQALFISACAELGYRRYDLLTGAEAYKRDLAVSERSLIWAHARRGRARLLVKGSNGQR